MNNFLFIEDPRTKEKRVNVIAVTLLAAVGIPLMFAASRMVKKVFARVNKPIVDGVIDTKPGATITETESDNPAAQPIVKSPVVPARPVVKAPEVPTRPGVKPPVPARPGVKAPGVPATTAVESAPAASASNTATVVSDVKADETTPAPKRKVSESLAARMNMVGATLLKGPADPRSPKKETTNNPVEKPVEPKPSVDMKSAQSALGAKLVFRTAPPPSLRKEEEEEKTETVAASTSKPTGRPALAFSAAMLDASKLKKVDKSDKASSAATAPDAKADHKKGPAKETHLSLAEQAKLALEARKAKKRLDS